MPKVYTEISIKFFLLKRLLGVKEVDGESKVWSTEGC